MPEDASQTLIDAGRVLAAEGLGDFTRGHISVRLPEDATRFLMKPHSFGLEEMTRDNLVVCDREGSKIGGGGPRHSEVFIHSEIFKLRPEVHSVIHAHPPHAVALSATGRALLPLSQPSAAFCDGLGVYAGSIDLIRTPGMGRDVAEALGPHKAVLMRNHGVAVVGRTVAEAVVLLIMLENACRMQLLCMSAGGPGEMFPDADVRLLHDKITSPEQFEINFQYLRRRLSRS